MSDQEQRWVAVSGGSGDIGRATCQAFLGRGWSVLSLDIQPARLEHSRLMHVQADTRDAEALLRAMREVLDGQPLHHLAAVAGNPVEAELEAEPEGRLIDPHDFLASLQHNLAGAYHLVWAGEQLGLREGSVTLVSSINARAGYGLVAYSAAKAGLLGLLAPLMKLLAERAVRVNAVLPGTIWGEDRQARDGEVPAWLARGIPSGRPGTSQQLAAVIAALALDLTHVNGQSLVVDGGQLVFRPRD